MTITLRAGVLNSGIQQNGTEFLTVDTSNNATLSNNLTVTGVATLAAGAVLGTPASGNLANCTGYPASGLVGSVTTPLSYVRLNTANGYGSTNTKIRRFTNIVNNVGTDITYADSATLGGTFTINTAGVYSVSYSDQFNLASTIGISINSTQLTTNVSAISVANALSIATTGGASFGESLSATFYAAVSDVVRAHTDAAVSGGNPTYCQFTIARVQ